MEKFEELMATLNAIDAEPAATDTMAKALPPEAKGEKDPSAKGKPETEAEGEYEKEEENTDDEGEPLEKGSSCGDMKKSFQNEEGEELIDATEILEGLQKSFATHDEVLTKALPQMAALLGAQSKALKEQGELIKSLRTEVAQMGTRGTGRKSAVTILAKSSVVDQPSAAQPAQEEPMTVDAIMAKANSLYDQKLLTGLQLTKLDVAMRSGMAPDADVVKILASH